jgi:hypothetical protein
LTSSRATNILSSIPRQAERSQSTLREDNVAQYTVQVNGTRWTVTAEPAMPLLGGAITLENGRVKQSNFHDYHVMRMSGMPRVDVHVVESSEDPKGVGEPAVPPIAPAVANAVAAATGKPIRSLPLTLG